MWISFNERQQDFLYVHKMELRVKTPSAAVDKTGYILAEVDTLNLFFPGIFCTIDEINKSGLLQYMAS